MTLPDERTRAVLYARQFLLDLLDPKKTPGVPKSIRVRASMVLRHYPGTIEMEPTMRWLPEIWGKLESPSCQE